ncbi:MAG: hypothetical protein ACE5E3_03500, partial [Mariprofundus sp.]
MKYVTGLILVLIFSPLAIADEADDIMEKAHLATYYAADDGKANVHMEIINPDGGKRIREFTI